MTDTQILKWLHKNMHWDGTAYWLPDICIREMYPGETHCPEPTMAEFRLALEDLAHKDD